jgi:flagellar FliJ protein
MAALKGIFLAIELATRQRDELAKAVAQAQWHVKFALDQMDQLKGYALDIDSRWTHANSMGLTAELVRHQYQFMERLQQAIGLQSGVLDKMQLQHEQAKKALLQAEYRLFGLGQLAKKRQASAQMLLDRREQVETDEFAAMQHARHSTDNASEKPHDH